MSHVVAAVVAAELDIAGGPSEPLGACVLHAKEDAGSDGGSKSQGG